MATTKRRPQGHHFRAAAMLAQLPELAAGTSLVPNVPKGESLVDFVKRTGKRVEVKNDDGSTEKFTVVEGDLLLDDDQLQAWADERETLARAERLGLETDPRQLVGLLRNGKILRWQDGLTLTYCVLKNTFPVAGQYQTMVTNMKKATDDWSATCGVTFVHNVALDTSGGTAIPAGATFAVRGINANGQFIASSFFPDDPIDRRRVLIDPSYFSTSFDKVGVLRHELGHVLGFRHEHIRAEAPPACPDEPLFGVTNLTAYDPQSTMHYFCGGVGTQMLAISTKDRDGSQSVYGRPLNDFTFVG